MVNKKMPLMMLCMLFSACELMLQPGGTYSDFRSSQDNPIYIKPRGTSHDVFDVFTKTSNNIISNLDVAIVINTRRAIAVDAIKASRLSEWDIDFRVLAGGTYQIILSGPPVSGGEFFRLKIRSITTFPGTTPIEHIFTKMNGSNIEIRDGGYIWQP